MSNSQNSSSADNSEIVINFINNFNKEIKNNKNG